MNQTPLLSDKFGRRMRKLRVSLLDACNLRCFYCMPDNPNFLKADKWLSPQQIKNICGHLMELGIEQIRMTGGEPSMRKDFQEIVEGLSDLPVKKLGLTSNAVFLDKHLQFLKNTKCQNINISLDSLCEANFQYITKSKHFKIILKAILKAKEMGFNVKINTVLIREINDHEVEDFLEFSRKYDIEVRFLELMSIGQALEKQKLQFISAAEVIGRIKRQHEISTVITDFDSTSFNFKTTEGAKFGFIASESKPFCNSCSRLRLSPEGILRSCLMSSYGLNLKDIAQEKYKEVLTDVIAHKPNYRIDSINENMNQIGG